MQNTDSTQRNSGPTVLHLLWVMLLATCVTSVVLMGVPAGLQYWARDHEGLAAPSMVAPYRFQLPTEGNLDHELSFYQDRISRNPTAGVDMASLAGVYLKKARLSGEPSWYLLAEQTALRSLTNLPVNNEAAVLILAHVAESRHEFKRAIELAHRVAKVRPADALAVYITSYLAMGRVADASHAADILLDNAPGIGPLTQWALVEEAQGRERPAIKALQKALTMEEPGEIESAARTRMFLGRIHFKRGRYALAQEYYREALLIQPQSYMAMGYLADAEYATGNYQDAMRHYSQAFAIFPQALYLMGMARISAAEGDTAAAGSLQQQAEVLLRRDLTGGAFGHRRDLGRLLLERGQPADLKEAMSLMLAEQKLRTDAETMDVLAWALSSNHRWTEALVAMQQALHWGVRDADMFYRAGSIEQQLGHKAEARRYFQAALATNPAAEHAQAAREALAGGR